MYSKDTINRFIRKNDPVVPIIKFGDNQEWDFAKMQKERQRSWHSRPYEYKFALDRLNLFYEKKNIAGRHMDLACGAWHPGYVVFADIENIQSVTALDLDKDLLVNGIDHPKVEKVISNAESTNFESSSFDTITCISSIEHMPNWKDVIKEAYKLLKPSGEFILTIDISDNHQLTKKHGVDDKTPQEYLDAAIDLGFRPIGEIDFSLVNAVDSINSQFPLYQDESEFKDGQHRALKPFRLCLEKHQ